MTTRLVSTGLIFENNTLRILDQRLLPDQEKWVVVESPDHMVMLIQGLAVRGAPLIGVSAALELARYAMHTPDTKQVQKAALQLREARPTAVNLMWAMDRMLREAPKLDAETLLKTAKAIFDEDVLMCDQIATHGADLIQDGDNILTICNTGGLATAGVGTAFGIIKKAFEQKKGIHVYACETRPLLQGARLTTWELNKQNIPHTLLCDSMAAMLMSHGRIQKCFVGADRIAANGDFANKIGTYSLAVLAKHHQVPFYVAAPISTVDFNCKNGTEIPIEERNPDEVRGVRLSSGSLRFSPETCSVFNPSFDVTPACLTSGIVLNKGIFTGETLTCGQSSADQDLSSLATS